MSIASGISDTGDFVIQTAGLTRCFGSRCAVDTLNLSVPRGSVFAFLGRNGSGKTTTIRMLLGLLPPTRGRATILGHDCRRIPPAVRARIGYMAEGHPVYGAMRVGECGRYQARFYPHWNDRVFSAVIDHFALSPMARATDLSRGERAGLSLAMTLAPEPELLVLDDPMIGLDPVARRALLEAIVYVTRRRDRTIFFSSHLLSDVERVADHVAILDRSVLRASCSTESFLRHLRQFVLRYPGRPPQLPAILGLVDALRSDTEIRLTIANLNGDAQRVLSSLGAAEVMEVPVSFEEAAISYLAHRGERTFFLQSGETGEMP